MVISPKLAFVEGPVCAVTDVQLFCFWFQLFAHLPTFITFIKLAVSMTITGHKLSCTLSLQTSIINNSRKLYNNIQHVLRHAELFTMKHKLKALLIMAGAAYHSDIPSRYLKATL